MYICTPYQMKEAEANAVKAGSSYGELMENAGRACAQEIARRVPVQEKKALILCGKGNNGGDGFVTARILGEMGAKVTVFLTSTLPENGIARENFEKLAGDRIYVTFGEAALITGYDIVCDAVFGTGFHGELSDDLVKIFERINTSKSFRISADVPSGINSTTGSAAKGSFRADVTVTFGAMKTGLVLPPAKEYAGNIVTMPIGISDQCFEQIPFAAKIFDMETAVKFIPKRNELSHKGHFGKLLIIAGSRGMSGAAALNVTGALRSGAGIVTLASINSVINRIASGIYECIYAELEETESGSVLYDAKKLEMLIEKADTIAIGSGLTTEPDAEKTVKAAVKKCLSEKKQIIIDADGLNCLSHCIDIISNADKAVLTPHPGELARLLDKPLAEITADRLTAAKELSEKTGAIITAKGFPTYVVSPDGRTAAILTGNGGMSRGGSGDLLTGVISGLAAASGGRDLFTAAAAGAYITGLAADIAAKELSMTAMLPSDTATRLCEAFKMIEKRTKN